MVLIRLVTPTLTFLILVKNKHLVPLTRVSRNREDIYSRGKDDETVKSIISNKDKEITCFRGPEYLFPRRDVAPNLKELDSYSGQDLIKRGPYTLRDSVVEHSDLSSLRSSVSFTKVVVYYLDPYSLFTVDKGRLSK